MKKSDLKWKAKFKVFTKKLKKKIINLKNLERYLNGLVKNLRHLRLLINQFFFYFLFIFLLLVHATTCFRLISPFCFNLISCFSLFFSGRHSLKFLTNPFKYLSKFFKLMIFFFNFFVKTLNFAFHFRSDFFILFKLFIDLV